MSKTHFRYNAAKFNVPPRPLAHQSPPSNSKKSVNRRSTALDYLPARPVDTVEQGVRVGYSRLRPGHFQVVRPYPNKIERGNVKFYRHRLDYSGCGDSKGLIYFLGTSNMKHPFENPSTKRECDPFKIFVRRGSSKHGACEVITGRHTGETCLTDWRNLEQSWVEIDLGVNVSIRPSRYMIRLGSEGAQFAMKDWVLEGVLNNSNEGGPATKTLPNVWQTIKEHIHDLTVYNASAKNPHNFAAVAFRLDDDGTWGKETGGFYRKIRIRLLGPNISKNAFLSISQVEVWGMVEVREIF